MTLRGPIRDGVPLIFADVRSGILSLSQRGGVPLIVDTGFAGSIAVPQDVADQLRLEFVATASFRLAMGYPVDLPTYAGVVRIGSRRADAWFIVGDSLIGMEFLDRVCSRVHLDLDAHAVELVLR